MPHFRDGSDVPPEEAKKQLEELFEGTRFKLVSKNNESHHMLVVFVLFLCVVVAFVVSPSLSPFFFGRVGAITVFDTHAKERLTRTCHENAKSDSNPARN